ncbi:MAG: NAD-dependent epimerase/dehydratase family protein [Promethearchaeota archaeon]|nr:MAG: NAD-dependent epimerase/dehydratase family protein [Candidatus Lokiarchaeota archaeon]
MREKTIDLGNCLVIGGSGMLGMQLVKQLRQQGYPVTSLDLDPMQFDGAIPIIGDIRNISDIEKACEGIDTIFQTASIIWDPKLADSVYYDTNVKGNQNVIDVCKKLRIPRLIYTSTLDVLVDGYKPISDGNDEMSYPSKMPKDPYSRTKILAEKAVLEANNPKEGLFTCSLRPVGIYGPGDKYHIGNLVTMARNNLKVKLGNGSARFSFVYVENVAHAHIEAAKQLHDESRVPGNAYIISDSTPPSNFFLFLNEYLKAFSLPPLTKSIPGGLAFGIAGIAEIFAPKAKFNRFSVAQTCRDHVFIGTKAETDFGYTPIVSQEEAFTRTVDWFKKNWI